MSNREKLINVPIVAVFLLAIYAVPVTQAVFELKRGGRIQALDLAVDATVTPFRSALLRHSHVNRLFAYTDAVDTLLSSADDPEADREKVLVLSEELLYAAEDLKKSIIEKNRHVRTDSTSPAVRRLDTLSLQCSRLLSALKEGASSGACAENLAEIRRNDQWLGQQYCRPSLVDIPLLLIKNLPFIFWNDRYLRPYEKEMENSSVFALTLRPRMFLAYFFLFRDLGEKGILGRNGWFFYKQDVDFLVKPGVTDRRSLVVDPNDKPLSDDPVKVILGFKEQLSTRGIDLLLVIVPGKPSIYPDLVSSRMRPVPAGSFSHSLAMLSDLEMQGVAVVDLFAPFARERLRDKDAGDSLYLREDTHWRARGVRCAAKTVADRVRQYPWFSEGSTEYVLDSAVVERSGDIGTMSALPISIVRGRYGLFLPEKTLCYKVYHVKRDSQGNETGRLPYKDEYRTSSILVLGDSFSRIYQTDEPRSAGWVSHLAYELSQPVASLVNDGGASTLVRQSLARKPNLLKGKKLVIWEVVERDFRYGNEGWKEVPLARE
jgi:hypothetical protein